MLDSSELKTKFGQAINWIILPFRVERSGDSLVTGPSPRPDCRSVAQLQPEAELPTDAPLLPREVTLHEAVGSVEEVAGVDAQ